MEDAKKKAGVPHSLSRKEEKANKRNTDKKRRQLGKKEAKQMENFDLIKQLQAELDAEKARQNEPQKPAEENPFAKAEEVARQLGLTEQVADPKSDVARLVKHYKGKKMSKDQMREKIAYDLEMLEYSPAQVSRMTKQVLSQCCESINREADPNEYTKPATPFHDFECDSCGKTFYIDMHRYEGEFDHPSENGTRCGHCMEKEGFWIGRMWHPGTGQ